MFGSTHHPAGRLGNTTPTATSGWRCTTRQARCTCRCTARQWRVSRRKPSSRRGSGRCADPGRPHTDPDRQRGRRTGHGACPEGDRARHTRPSPPTVGAGPGSALTAASARPLTRDLEPMTVLIPQSQRMQTITMTDAPPHSIVLRCGGIVPVGSDCDGMEAVTRSPPVRPRAAIPMINMHQMHRDQRSASDPSPLGATFAMRRSTTHD